MSLYDLLQKEADPSARFGELLASQAYNKRALSSSLFELTPICNFKCPFCYARMTPQELAASGHSILSAKQWMDCIDQLSELGVYQLTLTGGECTLSPDFCEVYRYAYRKGMMVTLMTNASGITPELLSLFHEMPPYRFIITIYGASPETYFSTCGNARFYYIVHQNIEALHAEGHQILAQFTAGKTNYRDIEEVYRYTKTLGIILRYNGDLLQYNRCTEDLIEQTQVERSALDKVTRPIHADMLHLDEEDYASMLTHKEFTPAPAPTDIPEKGVICNAGRSSCCIKWDGSVVPCITWDAFSMSVLEYSLAEIWKKMVAWADEVPRLTECVGCIHAMHCRQCMAMHYIDTHELGKPSPRLCWKITHPERAAKTEAFFKEHGYLRDEDLRS